MNERGARESAPTAAKPPSPDGLETPSSPSVTNEPNLPPIAADADDLEAIKEAVDDAAAVGGGLWLSYLFVLFYLAVAAGAVTHADLFFERPVKLPFLGIELPLVAFFALAPILFVVVHAYALVHLVMLTDKAKRYHQALYDKIGDRVGLSQTEREDRKAKRDGLRRQLPSNIFVQFLAGPSDVRDSAFGYLLRAIAWVTLVVAPVLLLLMMQIQFLPFHSSFIVWTQRVALLADFVLLWLAMGQDSFGSNARPMALAALGVVDRRWGIDPRRGFVFVGGRDLSRRMAGRAPVKVAIRSCEPCIGPCERDRPTGLQLYIFFGRARGRVSCNDTTSNRELDQRLTPAGPSEGTLGLDAGLDAARCRPRRSARSGRQTAAIGGSSFRSIRSSSREAA